MPRPGVPDPYRLKARAEGYVSRAVYKLAGIDAKYRLIRPGARVLDLGCSPGSWLQYIGKKVGPGGLAVGLDVNPPEIALAPPLYFVPGDVESLDLEAVKAVSHYFDVVLSDMAPRTTGVRQVDQQRSLDLAQAAFHWARELLRPGGHFLVKVFEGPDVKSFLSRLREDFAACHRLKPEGSRQASPELYLLAFEKRALPDRERTTPGAGNPAKD